MALSGTFPYCHTIFSRFYSQNKDVSLLLHHFLPELCFFSGHILPSKGLSPGSVAFFGTYPPLERTSSRKCGDFRDISFPRKNFLLEKWHLSGYFHSTVELSPGNEASFRTFPFCALWNFLFLKIAFFKKSATPKVFLFPKKDFTHLL